MIYVGRHRKYGEGYWCENCWQEKAEHDGVKAEARGKVILGLENRYLKHLWCHKCKKPLSGDGYRGSVSAALGITGEKS